MIKVLLLVVLLAVFATATKETSAAVERLLSNATNYNSRRNLAATTICLDSSTDGHCDTFGDCCEQYQDHTWWCGGYDTSKFRSNEMCCTCNGGDKQKAFVKQIKNLRATMTSELLHIFPARKCVDGIKTNMVNGGNICHGGRSTGDILTIYLPESVVVTQIKIFDRTDIPHGRSKNAIVKAGDKQCGSKVSAAESKAAVITKNCNSGVRTNTVKIQTFNWLNFGEVEVYGKDAN